MSRSRDVRRWRALGRQHDMWVRFTDGDRRWLPAPVSDFAAPGQTFCSGQHRGDEPCEGDEA